MKNKIQEYIDILIKTEQLKLLRIVLTCSAMSLALAIIITTLIITSQEPIKTAAISFLILSLATLLTWFALTDKESELQTKKKAIHLVDNPKEIWTKTKDKLKNKLSKLL